MDANEFLRRADECLDRVAKWLETLDPDEVDYSTGDGVVTIEFPDGGKFILSRQTATAQIWLAAGSSGRHYDCDAASDRWRDDKDGHDLYARLAELIGQKIGQTVDPLQ
jgi:CyaY protein